MKKALLCVVVGMNFLTVAASSQTSQSDSQTLKDILTEMRAIHADVRLSETTQILLTELQLQQVTATTALHHRDDVRSDLNQVQLREKSITAEIARLDDPSSDGTLDPVRKKQLADQSVSMKTGLAFTKTREIQLTNDLQEAEGQLSTEQSKLAQIQAQLDDQIKRLQPAPNP